MKNRNKYQHLKGLMFPYIAASGKEISSCFVAEIEEGKGLTIKAIDLDEIEKLGFQSARGTKDEGNMSCINLIENPDAIEDFNVIIKYLQEIQEGKRKVFNVPEIIKLCGNEMAEVSGPYTPSCAF